MVLFEEPKRKNLVYKSMDSVLDREHVAEVREIIDGWIRNHGHNPELFESLDFISDCAVDVHLKDGYTFRVQT